MRLKPRQACSVKLDLVVDRPALRCLVRRHCHRRGAHRSRRLALLVLCRRLRGPGLAALSALGARTPVRFAAAPLASPLRQPR
eukprot:1680750-Lingulodinium_polyedra.AAC.1